MSPRLCVQDVQCTEEQVRIAQQRNHEGIRLRRLFRLPLAQYRTVHPLSSFIVILGGLLQHFGTLFLERCIV